MFIIIANCMHASCIAIYVHVLFINVLPWPVFNLNATDVQNVGMSTATSARSHPRTSWDPTL